MALPLATRESILGGDFTFLTSLMHMALPLATRECILGGDFTFPYDLFCAGLFSILADSKPSLNVNDECPSNRPHNRHSINSQEIV
jgi:hypothetical protein